MDRQAASVRLTRCSIHRRLIEYLGEEKLQRLFSTFPIGLPGLGLLLLRAATGIILVAQGAWTLGNRPNASSFTAALALLALGSGISVLLGFFTPIGSALASLLSICIALSCFPEKPVALLEPKPAAALVAVIALSLAFLGPGGFSIDSRLFGRREIVIPQSARPPKH